MWRLPPRYPMLSLLWLALAACGGNAQTEPRTPDDVTTRQPATEPLADPAFVEQYAATHAFRLGRPANIQVVPGGGTVLFLRSGPRSFVRDLYAFDLESGEERRLLTSDALLHGSDEALSDEERARRERLRLSARGITSYELSADGRHVLIPLSGRLFLFDREAERARELPTADGYANDARFSPDGSKVAFVRDDDLYVVDVATGEETRITHTASEHVTNGLPEFVAQEEMRRYEGFWWSPDGSHLAYQETSTEDVEVLHILDPMHPEQAPRSAPYPRAGTTNARVRVGVVPVGGGETRWLTWDREAFPYLATVRWTAGAPLTLVVQNRRQTESRILTADPESGETRTLHVERDDAWVNLDQAVPHWIDGGEAFLWTTERDGNWALEVRSRQGAHLRTLTSPEVGYRDGGLLHVDEARGVVWVTGSPEPTETHVWRLPLDPSTGDAARLTDQRGEHDATVNGAVWVLESHPATGPAQWLVHRGDETAGTLRSVAEAPPFEPNVEWVTVGAQDYRAVLIRPRDFEAGRRYPVLVSVYGGPGRPMVRARSASYRMQQWFADHGYIVVSIDGRGTPGRGRDWERAIDGNFIDRPLEDHVAALEALGERFEELDLERVGIWGWSFGGYFSALAAMRRPDVFDAAVAGAPVGDWLDYDTHYTERYLGLPQENDEGYRASSVLTYAEELEKPLLIIHGTADDNVYFTHAIKMSDALLRAGRPHEFLPLSGFTHMVSEPEVSRNLQLHVIDFFERHLRGDD